MNGCTRRLAMDPARLNHTFHGVTQPYDSESL